MIALRGKRFLVTEERAPWKQRGDIVFRVLDVSELTDEELEDQDCEERRSAMRGVLYANLLSDDGFCIVVPADMIASFATEAT